MRRTLTAAVLVVVSVTGAVLATGAPPASASAGPAAPNLQAILRKAPTAAARRAVFFAYFQQGKPYTQAQGRRTGDFNNGFDCSGLIWRAYVQSGVWLGGAERYTQSMLRDPQLYEVPWFGALPGDIIFMTMPGERRNGHVVMSLGGDRIVEASSAAGRVHLNTLSSKVHRQGARIEKAYRVRAR